MHLPRRPALAVLTVAAVGGAANTTLLGDPTDIPWLVGVFIVPPWAVGRLLRSRRDQADRLEALNEVLAGERDTTARLTAEAERLRIASDIRVLLADGLRELTGKAERMAAATAPPRPSDFVELHRAGAATTAELRRLLGLLHA